MDRYYARDWDGAHAFFRKSAALEPNIPGRDTGVTRNPSLVYLDILDIFRNSPPPVDWDGVYVMKEK
jgi:hypothetical protein